MGEMADMCLDMAFDGDDELTCYWASRLPGKRKPFGPGKCPVCEGETVLKKGKFGEFYGCVDFPKCKGSRDKE